MACRQYSSCRTVNRMGTFAPALSQPSGQEFLRRNLGAVAWCLHLNVKVGGSRRPQGSGRAATEPHNGGAARRSLRSGHGSEERWDEIPEPAGCGNEGSSFTNPGSWHRRVRSHHGTWGLRRWMIGCSTIAFTPTPMWQVLLLGSHALAGMILGRSRRPLSSRCRCLSPLGVTTIGAAAQSLAPSATAGTDG